MKASKTSENLLYPAGAHTTDRGWEEQEENKFGNSFLFFFSNTNYKNKLYLLLLLLKQTFSKDLKQ